MSERSEYNPGEFCWVDLSSPDTEASARYYGELLGWKAESAGPVEETGGYGFFTLNGKQTAGYGPIMSEGQPPAWSSYVCVADADETVAKVKNAGGTVLFGPVDLPADSGRMAVCQDSGGAVFSIMQPKQHHGAQLVNEVGTWTWNQLSTRDVEGAKKFYGDVFGWTLEKGEGAREDAPYFMWQVDGQKWEEGLGGAMEMGDDFPPGGALQLADLRRGRERRCRGREDHRRRRPGDASRHRDPGREAGRAHRSAGCRFGNHRAGLPRGALAATSAK